MRERPARLTHTIDLRGMRGIEEPRSSISPPHPNVHIHHHGITFHLNKELMASRSTKLASLLHNASDDHHIDLSSIPTTPNIFEIVVRFCYGQDPELSIDTVIPIACLAFYLDMSEDRNPDNLIKLTVSFLTTRILPYWNETLRSLQSAAPVLRYAQQFGLLNACLLSISEKVIADPNLIGDHNEEIVTVGVKRRLFSVDRVSQDLTSLSLPLYELVMSSLIKSGVPPKQLARCIYLYMKKWVNGSQGLQVSELEKINQREVIEAAERLMPTERSVIYVGCLFEMLRVAIFLEASKKCRDGFEARIGKQLHEASVDDLCLPCHGYTKETKYDVKCIYRILDNFCCNPSDSSAVEAVLRVVEGFMAEAAEDENLSNDVLIIVLKKLRVMGDEIGWGHDGIYRVIDGYFDAHRHMTETEREEICKVLDCHRMSETACEHAAQSERMPMRFVAQVLFVGQIKIREAIAGGAMSSEGESRGGEEEKMVVVGDDGDEDVVDGGGGMVLVDNRVMKLEKENVRKMRGCEKVGRNGFRVRGLWKDMKDLFGCKGGSHQWNRAEKKQKVHLSI